MHCCTLRCALPLDLQLLSCFSPHPPVCTVTTLLTSCGQVKKHKFGSRFVLSACRLSDQVLLRCLRSGLAWTSLPWDTAGKIEGCYCLKPAHVVKRVEKGKQKGADSRLQENNASGKCVQVATTSGVTNV